jgi:hypothetical protein
MSNMFCEEIHGNHSFAVPTRKMKRARSFVGYLSLCLVQTVIKFYLLLHGKFFPALAFLPETHLTSIIAAPLAESAVRAGMLFFVIYHGASEFII